MADRPSYAEFFCGGGMVRAALGRGWSCVLANDIDAMKCATYRQNWGGRHLIEGDIADLDSAALHRPVDLYWASSPCQDFSLAGKGRGLGGARSGVFLSWMDKVSGAVEAGFAPRVIAFENVVGLISRSKGRDFAHVLGAISRLGYRVGALEIDARQFLPQSRPRVFVVAVREDIPLDGLTVDQPQSPFHSKRLRAFVEQAGADVQHGWVWWAHPAPTKVPATLETLIDTQPDTDFLSEPAVDHLLAMMEDPSRARVHEALRAGGLRIGALYKRGRPDGAGHVRQRAEVRFDGVAGCLRTPAGGSSRQTLLLIDGNRIRARLLSTREAARLMGLPDSYRLPARYNDAYKIAGDGVAVPVVRYLDQHLFRPLLSADRAREAA